jgi:TatD DNase family protein
VFDSHLHLTAERFATDVDAVISRARSAGVTQFVTIASNPSDARAALALARRHEGLYCTAGLHPHEASDFDDATADELAGLLREPEFVAVGEAGLDFHYDHAPRPAQHAAFEAQLDLAEEANLPIVVHSRSADEDMLGILRRRGTGVRGILHCFTGGDELLDAGLEAGWFVSFGGIITFGSFDAADALRRVPWDRLLLETDSPYLAPVPHRGKRNEPAFLPHTCARLAELRGVSVEAAAEHTSRAAADFYGIGVS